MKARRHDLSIPSYLSLVLSYHPTLRIDFLSFTLFKNIIIIIIERVSAASTSFSPKELRKRLTFLELQFLTAKLTIFLHVIMS